MKSILASRFRNLLLLAIATPLCLGGLNAKANLLTTFPEMGDLLRWGAFTLGGNVSVSDTDDLTGTSDIYGDVGVAGNGNIILTGSATIHGDLYYKTNGTLSVKGNAMITGARHHDAASDAILNNGVTEAMNTAAHAFALPVTPTYAGLTNVNLSGHQNITITGAPGQTVVLKLQNFIISSGTFTLQGSANTNFVINVSSQFSLTDHSQIILSGGVSWDDVLFNVVGSGSTATMSGGSTLNGVLMATNRTVDLSGSSTVNGEVIANKISLSGSSKIVHPPLSSP